MLPMPSCLEAAFDSPEVFHNHTSRESLLQVAPHQTSRLESPVGAQGSLRDG